MEFIVKPNKPFEFTDVGLFSLGEKGRSITELDLYGCENITDEGLLSLLCPNLKRVDLRFCKKLTALGVANFVAKCPMLQHLAMKQIDAILLSQLCCPNLLSFTAHDLHDATDRDLQIFLGKVPALEKLRLNTAPLVKGDFINALVEHCPKLRLLDLRNIPIIATEARGEMSYVTELFLDVPYEGIALILPLCPNVEHAQIRQWIPTRCTMLECVSIENGRQITDEGLSLLLTLCPKISDLEIKRCSSINGNEIKGAPVKLTNLDLADCTSLSDEGVENIMQYCRDLYSLSLTNCRQLTGRALASIAKHTKQLESLEITNLSIPIRFVAEQMSFLEALSLNGSAGITDDSLVDLASVMRNIERINLSDCPNITIKGLLHLVDHCPRITTLTLWNCKISEIELVMLEQKGVTQINAYRGLRAYSAENPDFSFDYYKETPEAKIASKKLTSFLTHENKVVFDREFPTPEIDLSNVISLGISDLSITDQEFDALLQKTPHLLELNLYDCPELTDKALESIGKHCQELLSLKIELIYFTSKGLVSCIKMCPQVVSLTCEHCNLIRRDLEPLYLQFSEEFPALGFSLH